ncbi:ankyrin repeat and death domain-containing protein 1A-like isoform X2 [Pomacea canaliculata]|uniref:ankyrin repeat and death domain-containing protein 1A-like isoform X2 n=1 Tax=Pomacea canaliculata TaxID=400727 RepID=UPI000D73E38C|nr:ankyrin repeat and death domain-containing protein 1A-like isoform X2 [Pomacea canaliculata]
MLEEAIRLGGNPNIINKHGAAAIHYAVTHCSLPVMDVLEKLVDAGADVNLRDDEGDNVLNLAIKNKQLWENEQMAEVVIFLLNCGAEASFKDLDGKDAFDLAGERGYHDILEILRRPQMTPRPTEEDRMEPIPEEEPEASITSLTPEEETEVESEAEDKQPAADVNTPNSEGLYPIHLAVQKEESQDRTVEVDSVIQQGARVNQTIEQTGNTALHLCAVLNHSDTADQLLRHGVDLSLKNKDGKTAYDLAKERGHRGVMAVIEAKLKGTQDKMETEKEKEKKSGSCHIL